MLRRIIDGPVKLLLSNHDNLIICFSGAPYPVWVWMPDNASGDEMEYAYQQIVSHGLLNSGHSFNVKYDVANYFIQRAAKDGKTLKISLNMYAYDCPKLVESVASADGAIHRCNNDDVDELVNFLDLFYKETGQGQKNMDEYRKDAIELIQSENMYFWKDIHGNNVACCGCRPNGKLASINLVFTHPEFRRKHYAENLVYQVTRRATDAGYMPMLYTDANYKASNECYEKIGYILRGKLCTIA